MSVLGELKRRRVFQVAVAYAVVAWLMAQLVDVVDVVKIKDLNAIPRTSVMQYASAARPVSEIAAELLAELEEMSQETLFTDASLTLAYLAVAQYEPALEHLAIAVKTRSPARVPLSEIKSNYWGDPVLDTDPRFVELREQIFVLN